MISTLTLFRIVIRKIRRLKPERRAVYSTGLFLHRYYFNFPSIIPEYLLFRTSIFPVRSMASCAPDSYFALLALYSLIPKSAPLSQTIIHSAQTTSNSARILQGACCTLSRSWVHEAGPYYLGAACRLKFPLI